MGFKVPTAVKTQMVVFWVVTPYKLVSGYHYFGGTYTHQL
jgi:hypothetical protein